MTLSVDSGTIVTLHFALVLEDGHVIDSNFEAKAATFTVGDGNLLPGFESSFMGLVGGDERGLTMAPESAFCQNTPHHVHDVENDMGNAAHLRLGEVPLVFADQDGNPLLERGQVVTSSGVTVVACGRLEYAEKVHQVANWFLGCSGE